MEGRRLGAYPPRMAISPSYPGKAELKVNGTFYGGWKSLRVTRSIEQVAGTFDLGVTDGWSVEPTASPIRPGQTCELLLDGAPVITGYVDDVEPGFDPDSHDIRVAGRDKTGDLVDCAAVLKGGQWASAKLERIANDLCAPFGIAVRGEVDTGKAIAHKIEPGETAFECLERAARMKAVLLVSNAAGDLVITRAGKTLLPVELVQGKNLLAGRAKFSWRERFSTYTVKGQEVGRDEYHGIDAAQPAATFADSVVSRYRPKVVLAETHGTGATFRDRAEWEANVRAGRGNRGTVTVQGWRREDGPLWMPNALVRVRSPLLRIDADVLIVGCTWILDERGTRTELSIARPEAFQLVAGVGASRLARKLNDKAQAEKKKKGDDWSML